MNLEVKNLLELLFKSIRLLKSLIHKEGLVKDLLDLEEVFKALPPVISNFEDLIPEIKSLQNTANEIDLIEFVTSQLGEVISDDKSKKIILAALDLVLCVGEKGLVLEQALKS